MVAVALARHDAVALLDGGLPAWQAAGGTLTGVVPTLLPRTFVARPQDLRVNADYVLERLETPHMRLVDARGADRFRGENETIDPVAGHIRVPSIVVSRTTCCPTAASNRPNCGCRMAGLAGRFAARSGRSSVRLRRFRLPEHGGHGNRRLARFPGSTPVRGAVVRRPGTAGRLLSWASGAGHVDFAQNSLAGRRRVAGAIVFRGPRCGSPLVAGPGLRRRCPCRLLLNHPWWPASSRTAAGWRADRGPFRTKRRMAGRRVAG